MIFNNFVCSLFLILNFNIQEGRLYIINNDKNENINIFIAVNHKVIKEKINENIEIVERIDIIKNDKIIDYDYYPKRFGHTNKEYFNNLNNNLKKKIIIVRLFYINLNLIRIRIIEE